MSDLISRKALIERMLWKVNFMPCEKAAQRRFLRKWFEEQPAVETFSKSYVDQLRWERDIAIEQLRDIGCEFGMDMTSIKEKLEASHDWIPISDRLPEEKGWYLCTCSDDEVWSKPIVRKLYYYPGLKAFVDNIRYEMNGLNYIQKFNWTKYVTAWAILPEPYKGERK